MSDITPVNSLEDSPNTSSEAAALQLRLKFQIQRTQNGIQRGLFKLITEQGEETQKILNYLDKHKEFFQNAFPVKKLWHPQSVPNANIVSPYLSNTGRHFLGEFNYFHLAAGCLCSPLILERLRLQLGIDLNNNPLSPPYGHYSSVAYGITSFFVLHNCRDKKILEETIVPRVKEIFTYLAENGYDFQNPKEEQLLHIYQNKPDYCGPEVKEFAQHIEVLIEKQMITQQLPEQIQNEFVGQLENKNKNLKI